MITLEKWHEWMHLYCDANAFMPRSLKRDLSSNPDFMERFRRRFEWVLQTQPISAQEWERRNDTSFDEDAELHEHLQQIYDFMFRDGPHP
ncbi:MAG: hypothetical protein ACU0B1_06220 [Thermohalobaculum sp.]